jgi:hypothetical protein
MKKFTLLTEQSENKKTYKVLVTLELEIESENEGEAGYISDSILSSIKEQVNYTIDNIEEKSVI